MSNCNRVGKIMGNPLCGLCEKVCISAKKVFDGSITRRQLTFNLAVTPRTTPPFTFVSAAANSPSTVTDVVTVSAARTAVRTTAQATADVLQSGRSRVSFNTTTPISVVYTDGDNTLVTADTTFDFPRDIVLTLPTDSVVPYRIEATTSAASKIGTINADGTATVTACVVQIVRVVADVELIVPTYGYCDYPETEEFDQASCGGAFALPVFPSMQ